MTAHPVDAERLALISAILSHGFREDESTEMIIGRLLQELGDGSQKRNEALREELAELLGEYALEVGAIERAFRFLAHFRRAMAEEMAIAEVQLPGDLPMQMFTTALDKAATSSEISHEQAREIVLRVFPDVREVLG